MDPPSANAEGGSLAIGGNVSYSTIHVGLDADATGQLFREALHPTLRLTRFEARTEIVSQEDSDVSLLSAYRVDVVPLLGRNAVLDDLRRWVNSKRNISIRVVTGGAGRGKTRLAVELIRQLSEEGWLAGLATDSELDRFRKQPNVIEWTWTAPTLVVIDYAASRAAQLRDWIKQLADTKSKAPLRLLLLERQAQREIGWLAIAIGLGQSDQSLAARALLDPPEPIELAEIDDSGLRREIFATLLTHRRKDVPVPLPGMDAEFDRLLQQEKWAGDPLFLMMAGLVAASSGVREALARSRTDLATIIAQREFDRVGEIAASRGLDASDDEFPGFASRHLAVLITLAQGLGLAHLRKLAVDELAALRSSANVDILIGVLRDALPRSEGERKIAPILPDLIGEAAILIWLGSRGVLQDRGIAALASIRRVAATHEQVSATLVRVAQNFSGAGYDEPARWLSAVAQGAEADLDLGRLVQISHRIPYHNLALREVAADIVSRIVGRYRTLAEDEFRKKKITIWGWIRRLVDQFCHWHGVQQSPPVSIEDLLLAGALDDLSTRLSDLGRREEALAASQEAADIYRREAQSQSDFVVRNNLPALARSLSNRGVMLSDLGRREEALAASQEAADIYRRLTQGAVVDYPPSDYFLPHLAGSLRNLAAMLFDLGRRPEALAASQEAADIYRRLAQSRPDGFLPYDLAANLGVRSNVLAAETAQAADEALGMLLPFVQRYPTTYDELARAIMADIQRYSDPAGQAPDESLLERAAQFLPPDEEQSRRQSTGLGDRHRL